MYICTFEHRELHQPSHRVRPNIYRDIEPTIWNLGCSKKRTFRLMAILLRHGFGGLIWHMFGISWEYLWLGVSWISMISFHVSDIFLGSELHISEATKRSVTWIVVWPNQVRLNMLIFAVYKKTILKVTIIINHVSQTNPCERLLNWMFEQWVGQGIGVDPLLCILFLVCHAETSWQTRKNSKDLL
jgi:hypothetical protein